MRGIYARRHGGGSRSSEVILGCFLCFPGAETHTGITLRRFETGAIESTSEFLAYAGRRSIIFELSLAT